MNKVTLSLTLLAVVQVSASGWLGWKLYATERALQATRVDVRRMKEFYQRDVEATAKAGRSLEAIAKVLPCVRQEHDAKLKYVLDQVVTWANSNGQYNLALTLRDAQITLKDKDNWDYIYDPLRTSDVDPE